MFITLIAIIFGAVTGSLLFLQLYNRLLLHMVHGRLKSAICYSAMVFIPGIPAFKGLTLGRDIFNPFTISFLIVLLFLEFSSRFKQQTMRKSRPVEVELLKSNTNRGLIRDTTETLVSRTYPLAIDRWSGPRLRIAHLSDFHVDKLRNTGFLDQVMSSVIEQEPDIIFLTGDYTDSLDFLDPLVEALAKLDAPLGIYSCLGNHDYWSDHRRIKETLEKAGVIFPPPDGLCVSLDNNYMLRLFPSDFPYIKPWSYHPGNRTKNTLDIVLSHTPDHFEKIVEQGVDIVFSGHLHGGQWRLPGFGSVIAPSIRDRLFDLGHFAYKDANLFVTAGIGNVWIPYRFNCPAEILLVDLYGDFDLSVPEDAENLFSQVQKEVPVELETVPQHVF